MAAERHYNQPSAPWIDRREELADSHQERVLILPVVLPKSMLETVREGCQTGVAVSETEKAITETVLRIVGREVKEGEPLCLQALQCFVCFSCKSLEVDIL